MRNKYIIDIKHLIFSLQFINIWICWSCRVIRWNSTHKELPLQSFKKFLKERRHVYHTCL